MQDPIYYLGNKAGLIRDLGRVLSRGKIRVWVDSVNKRVRSSDGGVVAEFREMRLHAGLRYQQLPPD